MNNLFVFKKKKVSSFCSYSLLHTMSSPRKKSFIEMAYSQGSLSSMQITWTHLKSLGFTLDTIARVTNQNGDKTLLTLQESPQNDAMPFWLSLVSDLDFSLSSETVCVEPVTGKMNIFVSQMHGPWLPTSMGLQLCRNEDFYCDFSGYEETLQESLQGYYVCIYLS